MTYSLAKSEAISLPSFFIGAALADTGSSLYKFLVRGPRSSTDFFLLRMKTCLGIEKKLNNE